MAPRQSPTGRDLATQVPRDVAEALALVSGRLGPMASRVLWFSNVSSTNDVAGRLADAGAVEGTLVGADAQSHGRGRHGRLWASPAGAGLYVSVLLRPSARAVPLLTIAAGIAVSDGIRAASGLDTCLKWPNDVLAAGGPRGGTGGGPREGGRKVAGILAEAGVSPTCVQHVVVGFGINLTATAYPTAIATRATSLEAELGRRPDRGLVVVECLAALWDRYRALQAGEDGTVLQAWRERARATLGRAVEWSSGSVVSRGTAEDVDECGALIVRTPDGLARVVAGEVRWVS